MEKQEALKRLKDDSFLDFSKVSYNDDLEALSIAINALDESIKHIQRPKVKYLSGDIEVTCPRCGYDQIFMDTRKGPIYCQSCGAEFDYSGEKKEA